MQPGSGSDTVQRRIRFTPRAEDMVAAQKLFSFLRLWSRAALFSYGFSLIVVVTFLRIAMADAPWPWIVFVLAGAVLGGLLTPLAMIRWYVPVAARRIYRQQRSLHREIAVEWDETELRAATETGSSRLAWADCFRWREDRKIILVFHAENLFQMMPKRVLSDAQIADLRAVAAAANLDGAAPKLRGRG